MNDAKWSMLQNILGYLSMIMINAIVWLIAAGFLEELGIISLQYPISASTIYMIHSLHVPTLSQVFLSFSPQRCIVATLNILWFLTFPTSNERSQSWNV